MDKITGVLSHVKFSGKNNFVIADIQARGQMVTVLGSILNPNVGQEYKLFGSWMMDPQWGKQFKFRAFETIKPQSTDGIYRYVVRMAKWVGPKIGKRLTEKYEEKTLDMLRENPEQVASDIQGITYNRAIEIQANIKQNEQIEAALVELEKLVGGQGLRASLPMDLVQKWGANAIRRIETNPYILTEMEGVGFPSADRIAINSIKVDPKSGYRQMAAILHVLKEDLFNGNTWMDKLEMKKQAKALISWSVEEGFGKAISKGKIKEHEDFVALDYVERDERHIAEKIKELTEEWI